MLEDMERRVRAVDIESIAAVMVTRDGRALLQRTEIPRPDAMLGGIVRLQRDVLEAAEEVEVPDA